NRSLLVSESSTHTHLVNYYIAGGKDSNTSIVSYSSGVGLITCHSATVCGGGGVRREKMAVRGNRRSGVNRYTRACRSGIVRAVDFPTTNVNGTITNV